MSTREHVVVRFTGDSGDGMQLAGTQFADTSASMGNDISTFPDFPAEIRAPAGTVAGVSGFQIHIGAKEIYTPGDEPDMLVAMNPAALKANVKDLKKGGALVLNMDAFDDKGFEKAGYEKSPLGTIELEEFQVIEANITSQTMEALKDFDLDSKSKGRCKNLYALGMTYFIYGRSLDATITWLNKKFAKKPLIAEANIKVLHAGYAYAETIEAVVSTYEVPAAKIEAGTYRQINGNMATAWGFIQAAQAANLPLFFGSYPITPASDVLHELSKHKNFGVKTFQAEDEIAGVCSAIGASFAGALGITSSSGPGIALKGEAIGLAMIYELPLVIINVQRGGPSTGLPTKTEQSDLNISLHGRNGESPLIVVAASGPADCFHMAYEAARLSVKYMTPCMFLTDGYIANGSEPWRLPDLSNYNNMETRIIKEDTTTTDKYRPYERDEKTLARTWAHPGTPNLEHRLGGLEKDDGSGNVSYDPENHEKMVRIRQEKVNRAQNDIPLQEVEGKDSGDLLVVSWGGTYGANHTAVRQLQEEGKSISLMHIKYISPLPKNTEKVLRSFKKVLVCELNMGQMKNHLNATFGMNMKGYNKIQGKPFKISELVERFNVELEG